MGVFDGAPKKAPPAPEKMAGKSEKQLATWREQVRAFEAASALGLALEGAFGDPVEDRGRRDADRAAGSSSNNSRCFPANEADPQSSLFPKISVDDRRRVLADRLVAEARARAAQHRLLSLGDRLSECLVEPALGRAQGRFRRRDRQSSLRAPGASRRRGEARAEGRLRGLRRHGGPLRLFLRAGPAAAAPRRAPELRRDQQVAEGGLCRSASRPLREQRRKSSSSPISATPSTSFPMPTCFPSVVVVRKPAPAESAPADTQVCVIPRDAVPEKGLSAAVAAATYPLPRAHFTKESWTLEPPDVVALLDKIKRNGVPLADYAGVKPLYGDQDRLQRGLPDRHANARPVGQRRSRLRRHHQALSARTRHRAVVVAALRPPHDRAQIERRPSLAVGGCA